VAIALGLLATIGLLAGAALLYRFVSGDGVKQALERQASSWLGQPVRIGGVSAQLLPRPAMTLDTVTVGQPVSLTLGAVSVSTDLRALISRRIENAEIVVSDSRIQMPLPVAPRGEPRPSSGERPAAGAEPIRLVSIRSIALDNVRLLSRGREIVVDADSALDNGRLIIRRFEARVGATALEAEGVVTLEPRVDAVMKVKANTLDVDELLALANAFAPAAGRGPRSGPAASTPAPRITARISAERARAGGVDVRQFATDMAVDNDRISLAPLTFQLFGGRYQGSVTARLGQDLEATLQSRIIDLDVGQLAAFGGVPGAVTGTLTGAGQFSGRGADMAAVLAHARGSGTATIVKGTIQRLNLLRTVVLFFGRPPADASPASDAFDRMDIRFSLVGAQLRAEAFALHSADADIVGAGALDVASKGLSGQFDVLLSEALSAQAGTDLRRYTREGNRVVLPARVGGTLGQPRLTIDAGAAVQRGLRNEVQRRLGGLLERFGKE
jgi:uncharacterized protein involved in outer membrane biogenesis